MSFHHENVLWNNDDGTWNRGYFKRIATGSLTDPDYDPEWDDEYVDSVFELAVAGVTRNQALNTRTSKGNPGGFQELDRVVDAAECDRLDEVLENYRKAS